MIPILLNKTKSLSTLVTDITAGIGEIAGAYDGKAVEEANGIKELSFKLPISAPRYSQITVGSYIKVKADQKHGLQIYEVYKISKPLNGIVTIQAQHISYMLGKATVKPFTATGITQTGQGLISNLVGTFPFTFESDIVNTTSIFKLDIPMSFRKCIGGWRGSVLDVFGGELDWDNLTVKLLAHRGADTGVKVEYGKNLTSLLQEESIANVYDAVIGYATINEVTYVGDIQKITITDSPRTQNVDFSNSFDMQQTYTEQQIKDTLNTLALAYAQNNNIGRPSVNLRVSFEPMSKFEEYKDVALLEQTNLFDEITILFPKLGVESKAKIIRTEYDFINEKMISVELGDARTNLLGLVDEQIESQVNDMDIEADVSEIEQAIGFLDGYVENLSQIITNGLGLFFTKVQKQDGTYQYYLHDDPDLSQSMNQWTINAGGFALSTDGGETWSAGIDAQGNAVLNSLSTVVLRALKIYGSYIQGSQIVFGDLTDKYITANPYFDNNNNPLGVSFDGTGTIRMKPQTRFIIENKDTTDSHTYNTFDVYHSHGTSGRVTNSITATNYNGENAAPYNKIRMYAYSAVDSTSVDTLQVVISNTRKREGTSAEYYTANELQLNVYDNATKNQNNILLRNSMYNDLWYANQIEMMSNSSGNSFKIDNYDLNFNNINHLYLDSNGYVELWSTYGKFATLKGSGDKNKLLISSEANIQDTIPPKMDRGIGIIAGGDMNISATGPLYLRGSKIYLNAGLIYLDSDFYVKWRYDV